MKRIVKPLFFVLIMSGNAFGQVCYTENFGDYRVEFDGSGSPVLKVKVGGSFKPAAPDALKLSSRVKDNRSGQTVSSYEFTDSSGQKHTYEVADLAPVAIARNAKGDTSVYGINIKNASDNKSVRYTYDAATKKCQIFREYDTAHKKVTYDREFCAEIMKKEKDFEKCKLIGDDIDKAVKSANERIEKDHKGLGYVLDFVLDPEKKAAAAKSFEQLMEAGKVCKSDPLNVKDEAVKPNPNVGLEGGGGGASNANQGL